MIGRLVELDGFGIEAVATLTRSGLLAPVPPATLARMVEAYRHFHVSPAAGVAMAAARWPERRSVVDESWPGSRRRATSRSWTPCRATRPARWTGSSSSYLIYNVKAIGT
ncbi:hypothetical protein ETD86_07170 [Nonomuraea turkmeniaca]|uniref:Uncharacterized protein n=1 Tax=Nonomuraea turkmeniaca TaxID=103838 RepID=A0A5S4FT03_9ACTN|nr:hypothetical protein [Nonomuraea turkmeniaca]TMR23763.1 hypothetical protein ETD86_07170 [Nonomuraea turkmeniaca]